MAEDNVFSHLSSLTFRLARFLKYSGDHPLEIRLRTSMDSEEDNSEEVTAVTRTFMESLWPHRRRWAGLTTDGKKWPICWTINNLNPEPAFPALHRLHVPFLDYERQVFNVRVLPLARIVVALFRRSPIQRSRYRS